MNKISGIKTNKTPPNFSPKLVDKTLSPKSSRDESRMKLDVNVLRYMSKDEFRVLTAVEMGMKNHEIVPAELVDRIAGLKTGGAYKNIRTLLRHKLVHHDSSKYDGYRLTNLGYDFLAIKTMVNRGLIVGVGRQIGVGKESDIFEVVTEDGQTLALKLHRLGRTSFRAVKAKRDYLKHRSSYNWLYLSRLAALKEYAFMKALHENGFPTPKAVDWNRHCVLMTLVPGYPLVQVKELKNPAAAFETIVGLIVRLAEHGLIHCDFNEFNLMIDDDENITMIDFPQMVSVSHRNAESYFDRDVDCIYKFFSRKLHYVPREAQDEDSTRPDFEDLAGVAGSLDKELAASGFTHQNQEDLQQYIEQTRNEEIPSESETGSSSRDSGQEEDLSTLGEDLSNKTELLQAGEEACSSSDKEDDEEEKEGEVEISNNSSSSNKKKKSSEKEKRLQRQRRRAAAAVRGSGDSQQQQEQVFSRNANKDKGGRRSSRARSRLDCSY